MSPATFRAKIKGRVREHSVSEDLELLQKKINTLRVKLNKLLSK